MSTAVSIGGDALVGSTPRELLQLYQADPETRAVVMFGEPGTTFEEDVADLLVEGGFRKPLIALVAGGFMEDLPEGTVFGHAAAIISGESGRPSRKLACLRKAGALVADRFDDLIPLVRQAVA